jgi:CRP-like cAMP-binding protein
MSSSFSPADLDQNRLLSLLPPEVLKRVLPLLKRVTINVGEFLLQTDLPISTVYFPLSLVSSSIKTMDDGVTVEVATVGNEGFVGTPLLLGSQHELMDSVVQIDGEAIAMSAEDFRQTVEDRRSAWGKTLLRYTQASFSQALQNLACNRTHTIEQRCARWILMTHDRVQRQSFLLGHVFLSYMLAAPESGITNAMKTLSQANLIKVLPKIQVLDREGLENASCVCYGIIKREYDQLLSAP